MKRSINNIPEGYKRNSTLGVIPNEWEVKRLGEIFEIIAGGDIELAHVKNNKDEVFKYPIYANAAKNKGLYGFSDIYKIDYDCITVSGRGDIGIANARSGKFYPIVRLLVLNPQQKIDTIYFENAINIMRIYCESTGVPQLTSPQLSKYKVLVPPLPEQRKIAEVLSTWDRAIEKQTLLVEKLELRKKGLMQQLLTGKKRLPGFSEEWKNVKLGDIAKRIVRKNNIECSNVVTISAQKGFVRQTDFFNKKIASETVENYYLVKRDEFCYNKSYCNGFPMGAIKRLKEFDQAVVTTLYICFSIQPERASLDFIEQYFSLGLLNRGLMKIANEGGRAHGLLNVTPNDFFNTELMLPPFDEQKAISSILLNAHEEVIFAKSKLEFLRQEKKGLMQVLLTGKKRVRL
jgi:type I restriction enzyme S subunit